MTKSAIAQEREGAIPSLISPADADARMDAEEARETEAYTLGVQTVLWGMQWVKAGQTLRVGAAPLPQGIERNPVDPSPHGINVWGHARGLLTHGSDDLPNVHALQKGYKLIALQDWGASNKELEPAQPMRPLRRTDTKTPAELLFFEELCETLKDLTLRDDELAFARQAGRIGVTLADGFQFEKLDAATVAGLKRAVLDAQSIIEHNVRTLSAVQPGGTWMVAYEMTSLDDWLFRGSVGWKNVWGDLASELLFPVARMDETGKPLNGERRYRLYFPAGQLPPARYWRISLYDLDGYFTANAIKRHGIGNMAEKLEADPDGSLTLYIQHDSPGKDKETNWLPAPKEGFFLMMRMYQPDEAMYRSAYVLPPLREMK